MHAWMNTWMNKLLLHPIYAMYILISTDNFPFFYPSLWIIFRFWWLSFVFFRVYSDLRFFCGSVSCQFCSLSTLDNHVSDAFVSKCLTISLVTICTFSSATFLFNWKVRAKNWHAGKPVIVKKMPMSLFFCT